MGVSLMTIRNFSGAAGIHGGGEHSASDLDGVLAAILERHGYDFRDYARPTLDRRIHAFMKS
jgi:hypothetical protein